MEATTKHQRGGSTPKKQRKGGATKTRKRKSTVRKTNARPTLTTAEIDPAEIDLAQIDPAGIEPAEILDADIDPAQSTATGAPSGRAATVFSFGDDPLSPHGVRPTDRVGSTSTKRLADRVSRACPSVPGVYGMFDRAGDLIYVGKSKALRSRLMSYFAASNANEKGGHIVENARVIQWETQPSEFAALLREQQLIRRFTPRWNVQGVPRRQRPVYLCLGREPAMFFVSATPPTTAVAAEGPFYGMARMRVGVEVLNKAFGLRDCSAKQVFRFSDQMDLFDMQYRPGCLRLETETCLGPCAGACSRTDYAEAIAAAQSFMDGFNHSPLVKTREAFERAVEHRQYELAGRLHTTIGTLEYIDRKLGLLASARRTHTFVYDVSGFDGCHTWYLIRGGEVVDVASRPPTRDAARDFQTRWTRWRKSVRGSRRRDGNPHAHTLSLVASWFKKHRDQFESTMSIDEIASADAAVA